MTGHLPVWSYWTIRGCFFRRGPRGSRRGASSSSPQSTGSKPCVCVFVCVCVRMCVLICTRVFARACMGWGDTRPANSLVWPISTLTCARMSFARTARASLSPHISVGCSLGRYVSVTEVMPHDTSVHACPCRASRRQTYIARWTST